MKLVHLFAAAMLALAVMIGCAGSSSTTPATTGGFLSSTPRIEAVVRIDRSNLKTSVITRTLDPQAPDYERQRDALIAQGFTLKGRDVSGNEIYERQKYTDDELRDPTKVDPNDLINPTVFGVTDPRNIQTGEQYYFQLVRYDENGNRIILDNVEWSSSDPSGQFGNIGSNSGLFIAGDAATQGNYFVFGLHNGVRYETEVVINPRQVRLLGSVRDEQTGAPIPSVELFFYDRDHVLVGRARTAYNGVFRASVPPTTVYMTPTIASVPVQYYQSFVFAGLRYTLGYTQCKAPLPAMQPGTVVLDQPILLLRRDPNVSQPPRPTGCSVD